MVSICTRSPGFEANGRSWDEWYLFQGLRFLVRPWRSSVRLTDDKLVTTPSLSRDRCTTSAQRLNFFLLATIASTIVGSKALGWFLGIGSLVGIGRWPKFLSFRHHLTIALWLNPVYRDTCHVDHPRHFTSLTASMRTFAKCGFFEYAIYLDSTKG